MKKFVSLVVVCVILALSIGVIAHAIGSTSYGEIKDVRSWIALYCYEWNKVIGKRFGVDMSFDVSDYTILEKKDGHATVNVDGIIFELDNDFYVQSMRVDITFGSEYYDVSDCRICAIIAALCYNVKTDILDLAEMYADIYEKYSNGFIAFVDSGASEYAFTVHGTKATHDFCFYYDGSHEYFSTHDLIATDTEDNGLDLYNKYEANMKEALSWYSKHREYYIEYVNDAAEKNTISESEISKLRTLNKLMRNKLTVANEASYHSSMFMNNKMFDLKSDEDYDNLSPDDKNFYNALADATERLYEETSADITETYNDVEVRLDLVSNNAKLSIKDREYLLRKIETYQNSAHGIDPITFPQK